MTINKKIEGTTLSYAPVGRLDTTTAPEVESDLTESIVGIKELVLDLGDVAYISSAGLRVILKVQKLMKSHGGMKVTGVNATVMEVFEITGFTDFLTIV
jgi:anti-sigma B factor antagonist